MGKIDNLKKQYENDPWITCNHCGVTFKGNHECDYERLRQINHYYKQALEFYADKEGTYCTKVSDEWGSATAILQDRGEKARQALKGVEGYERD